MRKNGRTGTVLPQEKKTERTYDSTFQILEKSFRGRAESVLDHPRVQDTQQWTQVTGSQISVQY